MTLVITSPGAAEWPEKFEAKPARFQQETVGGHSVWKSAGFTLAADRTIPQAHTETIARTCQSVFELLASLPLPLSHAPDEARIVVSLDEETHVRLGAPPLSAGYYDGRSKRLLLRGDLVWAPPSGKAGTPAFNDQLVIHETTHLVMDGILGRMRPWLSEGLAEYFAACHLGNGRFAFNQSNRRLPAHIRRFETGGDKLPLPRLAAIRALDQRSWQEFVVRHGPENRYRPYAASLLLAHYYVEGGEARRAELRDYLQALEKSSFRHGTPSDLDPGDLVELEQRLVTFWKARGLAIAFTDQFGEKP